jgi:hypothetical protein
MSDNESFYRLKKRTIITGIGNLFQELLRNSCRTGCRGCGTGSMTTLKSIKRDSLNHNPAEPPETSGNYMFHIYWIWFIIFNKYGQHPACPLKKPFRINPDAAAGDTVARSRCFNR